MLVSGGRYRKNARRDRNRSILRLRVGRRLLEAACRKSCSPDGRDPVGRGAFRPVPALRAGHLLHRALALRGAEVGSEGTRTRPSRGRRAVLVSSRELVAVHQAFLQEAQDRELQACLISFLISVRYIGPSISDRYMVPRADGRLSSHRVRMRRPGAARAMLRRNLDPGNRSGDDSGAPSWSRAGGDQPRSAVRGRRSSSFGGPGADLRGGFGDRDREQDRLFELVGRRHTGLSLPAGQRRGGRSHAAAVTSSSASVTSRPCP